MTHTHFMTSQTDSLMIIISSGADLPSHFTLKDKERYITVTFDTWVKRLSQSHCTFLVESAL